MDQHISRFNADADNPSQLPNHGVWPGLRLLLQSFLTSFLDLPDLADNKAQPRHVARAQLLVRCNGKLAVIECRPRYTAKRDPVVADDIDAHEWVLLIDPAAAPP